LQASGRATIDWISKKSAGLKPHRATRKIVVLGAGVQGTVFGVRLAEDGNDVTLIARPGRAQQLRQFGAMIQNIDTSEAKTLFLPILENLPSDLSADLCLVTVRREQLAAVLPDLARATGIRRIVLLVNHADGSTGIFSLLGRHRAVLAFPGLAGSLECGITRYSYLPQQATVVDSDALDVVSLFRHAGFRVTEVRDMDAWLCRHAVFITAIAGALYENDCDPGRLSENRKAVRGMILAVREGWVAMDSRGAPPAPFALRMILCWVPLYFSVRYWSRLLASSRGDLYFAQHARHAAQEMMSLGNDVRTFTSASQAPRLYRLLDVIDRWRPQSNPRQGHGRSSS
jgi:2-dehydropantoate 2-reductase